VYLGNCASGFEKLCLLNFRSLSHFLLLPPPSLPPFLPPSPQEYHEALTLFKSDPYGCHSQTLQDKRAGRTPLTPPFPSLPPSLPPSLHSSPQEYHEALTLFKSDPYGCHSQTLQDKRAGRNPFRRTVPYSLACPEIAPLLEYCQRTIYPEALPWDAH